MIALALTLAGLATTPEPERPPHVLLVLADDLGIGDVGAYNPDSKIPTPNLDRLAREGTRFTDAHSPSSVCTPTRYGVLTGRYCWRTRLKNGVLWGQSPNLISEERVTLPELLRSRGYRTAGVGKWHLGLGSGETTDWTKPLRPGPLDHGFDTFFGIPASLDMVPYVYVLDDAPVQQPSTMVRGSAPRRAGGDGFWRGGPAAPDFRHIEVLPRMKARALELLERAHREEPDRPFFLYFALTAPHTPWLPVEAFQGASEAGHYGDFVAQVDDTVGALLAAVDRLGIADETLVLVTSDNGAHWPDADIARFGHDANLGYRGQKADIWEGGHRVPFLVRWPGKVPASAARDDLLCLTDLTATLAALVGADLPDDCAEDSFDQSPAFLGKGAGPREEIVHHSIDGMFAIRRGPWKLVLGLGSGGFTPPARVDPQPGDAPGQLYHLGEDLHERDNVYLDRPGVVRDLAARLREIRKSGRSR